MRIDAARLDKSLGQAGRTAAPGVIAMLAQRIGQSGSDAAHALLVAQGEIARHVARQALTLSFNDVFRLMSWVFRRRADSGAVLPADAADRSCTARSALSARSALTPST